LFAAGGGGGAAAGAGSACATGAGGSRAGASRWRLVVAVDPALEVVPPVFARTRVARAGAVVASGQLYESFGIRGSITLAIVAAAIAFVMTTLTVTPEP